MKNKLILTFILVISLITSANAFASTGGLDSSIQEKYIEGMEFTLNFDYNSARESFYDIVLLDNTHPAGYCGLAIVEAMYLIEVPNSEEGYNNLERYIILADTTAAALANGDNHTASDKYFHGLSQLLYAWLKIHEENMAQTLSYALGAINSMNQAVREDPEFLDAEIGQAVYDYFVGLAPSNWNDILVFLHLDGDRLEGLTKINEISEHGVLSQGIARVLQLAVTIFYEKNFGRARQYSQAMLDDYPNNLNIHHMTTYLFIHSRAFSLAQQSLDKYREVVLTSTGWRKDAWYYKTVFLQGRLFFAQEQYEASLPYLMETVQLCEDDLFDNYSASWALLRIGMIYDMQGMRQNAIPYYQLASQSAASDKVATLARAFLRSPYVEDDPRLNMGPEVNLP